MQIAVMREEVERGKKETAMVQVQANSIADKCHKTQTYIRGLLREESSLNESLIRVQEENSKLDAAIADLDNLLQAKSEEEEERVKNIQTLKFNLANRELDKKRIENQTREKIKLLSSQREKSRTLSQQCELRRQDVSRLQCHMQETSEEINFVITRNSEIGEVNQQLGEDLKVCQRHQDNVQRINKQMQAELQAVSETTIKVISRLKSPLNNRTNLSGSGDKWACSSRSTGFDLGL